MKTYPIIFVILFISLFQLSAKKNDKPHKVIIAGKIDNFTPSELKIDLSINRPGFNPLELSTTIDSLGNFHSFFNIYSPTDVWIEYKAAILVLVHPGDSLYIEFNGELDNRSEILESIKFSGDAMETNKGASKFQELYYSSELGNYSNDVYEKFPIDKSNEFKTFVEKEYSDLFESGILKYSPNKEAELWADLFYKSKCYREFWLYSTFHFGKFIGDTPNSFYDFYNQLESLEPKSLISGGALAEIISFYRNYYCINRSLEKNGQFPPNRSLTKELMDSISVHGIIEYAHNDVLRQLVLSEFFKAALEELEIDVYEKYQGVFNKYITNPSVKAPLCQMYLETKRFVENPKNVHDSLYMNMTNSSLKEIIEDVLIKNKDKVIYIDTWATWCGPCLAEMPSARKLETQLKDTNTAFVYFCIDSKEELWRESTSKIRVEGQHYFLTKKQSDDLRNTYGINGIPYYFLINKNGTIVEKGSHLRPYNVKEKIVELLKK